ncbi:MAG: erythromycin esterase family protein [Actinobacteria bacterium]|nr:erythromycin esterase family protein [Actinomycetota bacterium]
MTHPRPHTVASDELGQIDDLGRPLRDSGDLDPLLAAIGDCRFVLLGEASHGTHEYYRWRSAITKRLVEERGFSMIAVEGDWPDCYAVNEWVRRADRAERAATEVLAGFARWPTWMWANHEVADLITWMRSHNTDRAPRQQVGFYGIDVYSLWESLRAVMDYLTEHDPDAVQTAADAIRCFDTYGEDPQQYAWAARLAPASCEDEVVDLLVELHRGESDFGDDPEARFDALQNAEVLAGAEKYYRTMVRVDGESWNVRDLHMADTLDRLVKHHGGDAKAVVWEHNTHVGDARATDMAAAGMVNVGQVVRERHLGAGVALVGFGGHRGSVIAAEAWGAPMQRMAVPAAPEGAHEGLIHEEIGEPSLFVFPEDRSGPWLSARRGHRAIGVVYHPERDRPGNWVPTVIGRRYDAFLYFEETQALHPLVALPVGKELETYPWNV